MTLHIFSAKHMMFPLDTERNTRIYNLSPGLHITYFSAVVAKKQKNFE